MSDIEEEASDDNESFIDEIDYDNIENNVGEIQFDKDDIFCPLCRNWVYTRVNKNTMYKYCKKCNKQEKITDQKSIKLSETKYKDDDILFKQQINKHIRENKTLKRIRDPNLLPPPDYKHTPNDPVLCIKYNYKDASYMYISMKTGEIWKNKK